MKIEIIYDEDLDLYAIKVNGEIRLDCLSEIEVKKMTIGEIAELLW